MKLIGPINQRRYLKPEETAKICVQVEVVTYMEIPQAS